MNRRSGRQKRASLLSTVMAVVIILFLVLGTLGVIVSGRGGSSPNSSNSADGPARITPGSEVNKLETQVALNPDDAQSISILAEVLANSGRVAEAIPWYEKAVAQQPEDEQLRLAFGRALARNGSAFDAELQLQKAVDLAPTDPLAAYYLAQLYDQMSPSRLADARAWYQKAIDINPDSVVATQARQRLSELDATPTTGGSPAATP